MRTNRKRTWTQTQLDVLSAAAKDHKNNNGLVDWKRIQANPRIWDVISNGGKRNLASVTVKYRVLQRKRYTQRRRGRTSPSAVVSNGVPSGPLKAALQYCPCCGADLRAYLVAATL